MGKNKLKKFDQIKSYNHVIEKSFSELKQGFNLKGRWKKDFFKNNNPITLELGCGKGEYTLALSKKYPDRNFIGIDIKGARIWKGATEVKEQGLKNVCFLRIRIDWIEECFSSDEINEIWLTFPDPQLKKRRAVKRLTHPIFLRKYAHIIIKEGLIHLKTDSQFLYGFTFGIIVAEDHFLEDSTNDLYASNKKRENLEVKTHYEQMFLLKNKRITYLSFRLNY